MPDSAPFPLELTPSLLIRCFPSFQVIPNALPQSHLLWFLFISSYSIFGGKAPHSPYNNPSESVIRHCWGSCIYLFMNSSFSALLYWG